MLITSHKNELEEGSADLEKRFAHLETVGAQIADLDTKLQNAKSARDEKLRLLEVAESENKTLQSKLDEISGANRTANSELGKRLNDLESRETAIGEKEKNLAEDRSLFESRRASEEKVLSDKKQELETESEKQRARKSELDNYSAALDKYRERLVALVKKYSPESSSPPTSEDFKLK